jgi:hypothetical protein
MTVPETALFRLQHASLDGGLAAALGLLVQILFQVLVLGRKPRSSKQIIAQATKKRSVGLKSSSAFELWTLEGFTKGRKVCISYRFKYLRTDSSASLASTTGMVVRSARRQIYGNGTWVRADELSRQLFLAFQSRAGVHTLTERA